MEDFLKNIKEKISVDNLFSTEKAKEPPKDGNLNRDEDVHRTLVKLDPNDMIDPEEVAARINEIHEHSKMALDELKNQSNKVVDTAKSQSSNIIDSAKMGFGILQKPHTGVQIEEEDPYTADDLKQESNFMVDSADLIAKLDEVQEKSWSALDEIMTQSNQVIETAKSQSNQIIESALTNLNIIKKASNQSVSQDRYNTEDQIIHIF